MSFVNVHTHSHFSRMDSIAKPKDIVARVKAMGQTAVAISDHGVTSGLIETYKECQKQNIKMLFAVEHYLVPDVTILGDSYRHIMLWAKDNIGYKNLLQITTEAHANFHKKPRIDLGVLRKHSEGIAVSSACLGGWLRDPDGTANVHLLEQMLEIFPGLYIEIHTYSTDEQKEWNQELLKIARSYELPLLAACDAHYVNKDDAYVHKQWLTQGKEREDGYYQIPDFYLHAEHEVREKLSYLPVEIIEEAITNTQVLADSCNVSITFGEQHYPTVDVTDQRAEIRRICNENIKRKVPDKLQWPLHVQRYQHEMPILENAKYFPYFLIMHGTMEDFRSEGINISPSSRGSVGGCDVAYLMNIHNTDPLKHDLMFARFLHEERVTPCDIDLDVSKRRRGDAIEIIKKRYGYDRVFQARTYGYMAARGALKRAGKSLGYDPQYILELSKQIPKFAEEGEEEFKGEAKEHYLLDNLMRTIVHQMNTYTYPMFYTIDAIVELIIAIDEILSCHLKLISLAKSFVGILQSFGIHASAIIVFPDDPTNYCAIEKSGDNYVTAYEFHTLEDLGILKLDILGIKTIDVIYDTLELIGNSVDINSLPPDDQKTFDMLCNGYTAGVFQVEGRGFTELIKRVQPRHFDELAPLLAVYRPALIAAGLLETYIRRRTGEETIEYLHPDLEPLLNKTFGLMIYQENIIEVAKEICGYTPGQADLIRRACGRKKPEEMEKIKPDFIQKTVAMGYSEGFATELFGLIEYFAGYGFGKAHTFGYGELTYVTAYLKAHYPKEFMVSLINSEESQEKILPYIEECKTLGIKVLPPELSVGNRQWIIEGNSLRIGLSYIKGIGKNLSLDNAGTFSGVVSCNSKGVTEALIKAGALDYLGQSRRELLGQLQSLQDLLKREQQCQEKIQENKLALSNAETEKDQKKYKRQLQQWQKKLKECKEKAVATSDENYNEIAGEFEVLSFSFKSLPKVITGKLVRIYEFKDKKDRLMCRLNFSTIYSEMTCVCFSSDYEKLKSVLKTSNSYKFVITNGVLKEIKEVPQ